MVPQQHRQHRVVLDPIQPDLRVDLRRVVVGVEAIALQAARRHQDEDAERRVAEAEAFRQRLAHQPDQQIDRFEIVVVDAADLFAPDRDCRSAPRTT